MRFLLLAIFSSAVVAAGVVPLLDCSTVAQAQQDQITAERLFASLKGCIASSVNKSIGQGETSKTAMRIVAAKVCARPYQLYIAAMCKGPNSPGCDNPEVAAEMFTILFDSMVR